MTILGRYLSKMKLRQWAEYGWEDTERLEEEDRAKKTRALQAAGYSGEEIEEKLAQDFTPDRPGIVVLTPPGEDGALAPTTLYEEPDTVMDELTDEDKMYLRLKWGKGYRADEWVRMEQLYEDMLASYDIQGAGHKDTLVMICKLSLKVNQLLDIGDIDGAMKAEKMYDNLMKSGKFTAAQNKGETGEFIDSIGELVSICEKEGFIPRYYTDGPQDKIDETLEDFKRYTHTLVTEELNLGDMIESSLKQIVRDREEEAKITTEDGSSEDENLSEIEYELRDSDFEAFYEAERERAEATQLLEEEG